MSQMTGKVALVIGGASGIGEAIARRLADAGASVFLTGRHRPDVEATAQRIGRDACGIVADAGIPPAIGHAAAIAVAAHGRIDVLVHNAALSDPADLMSSTADHFDRHFALNVRSPLLAMKAAVPHMPPGSAAVMVGSAGSQMAVPFYGAYASTKAALRSYVRTWTAELAPRGIRVNVLSPGPTDTAKTAGLADGVRRTIMSRVPAGRIARPEEIAAAALFLASDESAFMAGADLQVDGGMAQI